MSDEIIQCLTGAGLGFLMGILMSFIWDAISKLDNKRIDGLEERVEFCEKWVKDLSAQYGEFLEGVKLAFKVSIHARAERATRKIDGSFVNALVSIHARAERATSDIMNDVRSRLVSIHARAERATLGTVRQCWVRQGFNPRTRRACDIALYTISQLSLSFNPRTRRACDARVCTKGAMGIEFQSTHAQSVRPGKGFLSPGGDRFQSTHAQSVRLLFRYTLLYKAII